MLIVNFQQKAALNFDHITLMNVNKNKLIFQKMLNAMIIIHLKYQK